MQRKPHPVLPTWLQFQPPSLDPREISAQVKQRNGFVDRLDLSQEDASYALNQIASLVFVALVELISRRGEVILAEVALGLAVAGGPVVVVRVLVHLGACEDELKDK